MTHRIWYDLQLSAPDAARFSEQVAPQQLEKDFAAASIAFGQPNLERCLASEQLAWVHLSSAGWDRFDQPRVRTRFAERGIQLTNSASVYREPCAQHLLSFLLADARQLPRSFGHQSGDHAWAQLDTRADCRLLGPQSSLLLVGFGTIAARLAELLAPFGPRLVGVRRSPSGSEPIPTVSIAELPRVLSEADHVVNILPGGASTRHFFDAARFEQMKPGAAFYNIGRGSTVDQLALSASLASGRLRAAYLDVVDPEPLPVAYPLWQTPGCTITPHSAGGHSDEQARLLAHFIQNLQRFSAGEKPSDRVL